MTALRLYQLVAFLAAPFLWFSLARRARKGREDRARLREKYGYAALKRPPGHLIWVHAASVGETNSILPLLEDVLTSRPAQQILLTTGTLTSAQTVARWQSANRDLRARMRHQFAPLDRPAYIRRFLDHWQPDAALWVESEIWPNLVHACHKRGIALVMVNGRISQKSFAGWQRFSATAKHLLGCFTLLMAQDDVSADHLARLGAAQVKTPGNLKLDAPPLPYDEAQLRALKKQIGKRAVFLAASTHPNEEAKIADALAMLPTSQKQDAQENTLAIIAPRHPDRGTDIAAELRAAGYDVAQRSESQTISQQTQIYLADTLGELGLLYRLTDIVFIGGTLVPHGGQNPMEAAQLDCALLHGPHVQNFTEIFAGLAARQAIAEIGDSATLAAQIGALMQNKAAITRQAEAAKTYAHDMGGARAQVLALIEPYLVDPKTPPLARPAQEAHDG